ncbi:MAG: hypothetical protein FRX49_12581 [Trebouxia sp. A1-2]|nr:MAG: hypothetical protein FRX49_12581 [Trebouxia sp. A1-2]
MLSHNSCICCDAAVAGDSHKSSAGGQRGELGDSPAGIPQDKGGSQQTQECCTGEGGSGDSLRKLRPP